MAPAELSVVGADQLQRDLLERVLAAVPVEGPRPLFVLVDPDETHWDQAIAADAVVVVITSTRPDHVRTAELIVRGADAVVPVDAVHDELCAVVRDVLAGRTIADGLVVRKVAEQARHATIAASSRPGPLSPRELEILRHIAQGLSVKQTARALAISAKTVENTRGRLFKKLGVRGCAHAVARGYRLGLIAPDIEG